MLKTEQRREELLVNMTPMIDVMIFLIVFFLAATNFAEIEREHDIKLPETRGGTGSISQSLDKKLIINIKKDGTIIVDGKKLNQEQLKSQVALRRSALKDALKVQIRPDKQAAYEAIAPVLNLLQKAGVSGPAMDTKETTLEP